MFKGIVLLSLIMSSFLMSSFSLAANSRKISKKKKKGHKIYKVSKHKRKSRQYKKGSGLDLKSMTTDSPYTEDSNNGINPIEIK